MRPARKGDSHEVYVCPWCRSNLTVGADALSCGDCGRLYPVRDGIPDFLEGRYYDQFDPDQPRSPDAEVGLHCEAAGAADRIPRFYLPRIEKRRRVARDPESWRVLDCGCGNGLSVDLLNDAGVPAWGNDTSALRRWQWKERKWRERLFLAEGGRLPIADGFFDVVLASGVLEHIGVEESRTDHYEVRPLPSRAVARAAFLAELLRVTAQGGALWLDFPNGAFPIDFWHGDRPGAARLHSPAEGFLPTPREVRRYVDELPLPASVRFESPDGRLQMRQVGKHWYGRLFSLPVRILLRAMKLRELRFLTESPLNPYLVAEIERL